MGNRGMQRHFVKDVHGTDTQGSGAINQQNQDLTQLDIGLITEEDKHPSQAKRASSEVQLGG